MRANLLRLSGLAVLAAGAIAALSIPSECVPQPAGMGARAAALLGECSSTDSRLGLRLALVFGALAIALVVWAYSLRDQ